MNQPRVTARVIYVATALSVAAFVGGFALAGSLTISSGSSESANGNFESTNSIAWWTQSSVGLSSTPSTVPTSISTTAGSPTVLGATATSYLIGSGTAGDVAHFFKMSESTSAPVSTEIEIVFTISTGSTPTTTTSTVYLETQSTAPGSALTFTLFYDLGSAGSGTIVLNSVQEISQLCSAVGTCP